MFRKNVLRFVCLFLALGLLLAACSAPPASAPADTQEPLPIEEELPTAATETLIPEPSIAPSDTAVPEPTATATSTRVPGPVEITIWYGYASGAAEEIAFINVVKRVREELPDYTVRLLRVPFNDIFTKYRQAVAAGEGPDMLLAPNDSLGNDARQGLVADITDLAAGKLDGYDPRAVEGLTVDGRLYGIPETFKSVVFWYNKSLLSTPPATTDELKTLMEGGTPDAVSYNCYYHFGFFGSFGGKLFDQNWNFTADKGGFVEGMTYLASLYDISSQNEWPMDAGKGMGRFRIGKVAAIIDGNWVMGDYQNSLANQLAVAPLPASPGGPATPLLGVDGFYVNPNSQLKDVAVEVALHFTNQESQIFMMQNGGHVPVRTDVEITDPLIQGLMAAFQNGYIRPQVPQFNNYWTNFCSTNDVLEADAPAADWVKQANDNANR